MSAPGASRNLTRTSERNEMMSNEYQAHSEAQAEHRDGSHDFHRRPYRMFWVNMVLGLVVMYVVMFSMIDGAGDFRNNLNMFYMAVTMWGPMGFFMLATMPGMYPNKRANLALYILFALLTVGSFWATRAQALINDRQFINAMIPHHSGAILMCRGANLSDSELVTLCGEITKAQREEILRMEKIAKGLQ